MSAPSLTRQLQVLGLLDEKQATDLENSATQDPSTLASELQRRGWATEFQAGLIADQRARDLRFGPYLLLDKLAEGGMGEVYRARHVTLDRLAALKLIRAKWTDSEGLERFRRETRAAARLNHPNIVTLYDADEMNGIPFAALELVDGTDLSRLVKRNGPLSIGAACAYVRQAAAGLHHAHRQGIIHRDVKPSNLILARAAKGEAPVVKVLDFGLARFTAAADDVELTGSGALMGTPAFIAPNRRRTRAAPIRAPTSMAWAARSFSC